jgi:branched-chain amino acid transport system substrate-binding protein
MKKTAAAFLAALVLVVQSALVPAPARADAPDVVIGAILPLTGSLAPTGQRLRQGMELAADLVNGRANLHYPLPMTGTNGFPNLGHAKLRVVFADSQGKPDQAKTVAEDLINREHVVALIGCYASGVTATASQVAERDGIPFLNPDSTSPALIARGFKWFFRTTPDDATFSQNFFDFLHDLHAQNRKIDPKKVALVSEDTLFGKGAETTEAGDAAKAGMQVVADLNYPQGTSEAESEVQRLKAASPDIVIIASLIGDAILFMKTFKAQNFLPQAILAQDAGFVDPTLIKTIGKDADGVLSREVWSLNLKIPNQGAPLVNQLYKARYGSNMDGNVARDFMGVLVLADAIERAKSTQPEAIRSALAATNIPGDRTIMPWVGIKFDARGQNIEGSGIIVQIQNGEYQTVWPAKFATRPVVWPLPAWSAR